MVYDLKRLENTLTVIDLDKLTTDFSRGTASISTLGGRSFQISVGGNSYKGNMNGIVDLIEKIFKNPLCPNDNSKKSALLKAVNLLDERGTVLLKTKNIILKWLTSICQFFGSPSKYMRDLQLAALKSSLLPKPAPSEFKKAAVPIAVKIEHQSIIVDSRATKYAAYPPASSPCHNNIAENKFNRCELEAKQGHPQAQYNVGVMLEEGIGVNKDLGKAAKYYSLAAEQGHIQAQCSLASMYECGKGVPKDEKKAFEIYKAAADKENARGLFKVGVLLANGLGVERNYEKAIKYLMRAAEKGHVRAEYNVGLMLSNGYGTKKDEEGAVKYFRSAALKNDAKAQYNLALRLSDGHGIKKNPSAASKYFKLAADQGHAESQFIVGRALEIGKNKDFKKACEYYSLAADQGHVKAKSNLERLQSSPTMQ